MLRTDEVREILKENGKPLSFDDIWKKIKSVVIDSIEREYDESRLKSDLYISLMEDSRIIMVSGDKWDLKEKYSLKDQDLIDKTILTEELEISLDESDETKELNLKVVSSNEDN